MKVEATLGFRPQGYHIRDPYKKRAVVFRGGCWVPYFMDISMSIRGWAQASLW